MHFGLCKEELNLMLVKDLVNESRCGGFELAGTDSLFTALYNLGWLTCPP